MGKITLLARTSLLIIFLLGSSITFLTAKEKNTAEISVSGTVTDFSCDDDTTDPVAKTQNITVRLNSTGNISISTSDIDDGSTDNCEIASYHLDKESFDCTNLGENTVNLTVEDATGNTASKTAIVTVEDNENPTISAPATVTANTDAGSCAATNVSLGTPTTSDNCTGETVENNAPASFPIGETTVIWTVTDATGNNTATDTQIVNVVDNENPTITAPATVTVNTDAGSCAATNVALGTPTTSDNCTGETVENNAPASFPIGETTVNWTVTDASGNNIATDIQIVKVVDDENPTISAKDDITVNNDTGTCGANVNIISATAADNCGVTSPSGSRDDNKSLTDAFPVGTTIITWNVTDDNGNSASPVEQSVTVNDNEAPVPPELENTTWGCEYTVETPVALDNCDNEINGVADRSTTISSSDTITWTFTDESGNSSTASQIITIEQLEVDISKQDIICNGSSNGEAEAVVTGGVAPFTYNWGALGTGASKANLEPGNYSVVVTDANGCTSSQDFEIMQPQKLDASITHSEVTCFDAADGNITLSNPSGGFGNYEFSIDNGQTWQADGEFTGLNNGNYQVIIRDADYPSCTITLNSNLEITQPEILHAEIESVNVTCNGNNDGKISVVNPTGGHGRYQYSINGGTSWENTAEYDNLSNGSYNIQIRDRDETGCIIILNSAYELTQPDAISIANSESTAVTCFGGNDGTITAGEVTGGTAPYEYSIDNTNFNTTGIFENVLADTHTIFVVDANGCAFQTTVSVEEPAVLNANINRKNVSCFEGDDGEISLSNTTGGSGSYEFSTDGINWTGSTESIINLTKGSYEISIRDSANTDCVIILQDNFEISEPSAALTAEITAERTTTYGTSTGSATAEATGGTPGYTYEWRKINDSEILQTTKTATNLAAGFYEATVIDAKGCEFQQGFEVIDAIEAFILTRSTCEIEDDIDAIRTFHYIVEDETAFGGVAPYTYSWDFGVDATDRYRDGIGEFWVDYTSVGNKTITLTVKDSTGATFTTTQDQYIAKCYNPCGKSSNIEFDPNNIYLGYSDGTPMDRSSDDYCDSSIGKYIFIQVDKSANIYNPYIEISYIISNDIDKTTTNNYVSGCREGEDIDEDLEVNQPNRVGGFIKLTLDPLDINCGDNLSIDTFYTTWTNVSKKECGANNNKFCYSTNEPVLVPTELRAEATPTHILCIGDSSGTITVEASGGFAPYGYTILGSGLPSQTTNQFTNLVAGDYTIEVEDAAGNKTTTSATVDEPDTNVSATVLPEEPSCFGETGEATVNPEGGTPFEPGELPMDAQYEYLWNDPSEQTTATAIDLPAGDYTVTVIDANGCQTIETVTITEPEQLTVADAGEDQSFNCGFNSTILEANTPETGVGVWTIESGAGGTIADVNDPGSSFTGEAGTYTLRWSITHADGTCGSSSDVNITFVEDCSKLDFDGVDDHIVFGDNYSLSTGNFTLEAWVKLKSDQGVKTVISKRNSKNLGEGGYDLIINNGAPTFRWGNNSVSASSKINTSRWHHIAVIFKDSKVNLYVDGLLLSNATSVNPTTIASPFMIGAMNDNNRPDNPENYFNGWIEEVRIWKTALTEEQLQFMMNQRLEVGVNPVKGTVLPLEVPGSLGWENLQAYYQLIPEEVVNGFTLDKATANIDGELKNIETTQENTAPLPYYSAQNTTWADKQTWLRPDVWDFPNSTGINGQPINWNIVSMSHEITSGGRNITLLGLLSEAGDPDREDSKLTMEGSTENGTGNGLTITHYLKLDGVIDLDGESQLVQTDIDSPDQTITSVLEESSSGYIERDQQGTANSYNYNYWTSPVSLQGAANNSTYTIETVMLDGSATSNFGKKMNFGDWHEHADGAYANPRKISNYWLHKFRGTANVYSEWEHIGSTGTLNAGEGYTMKGTSGHAQIEDRQNYVFKGKPNNGTIALTIAQDQNYLLGNPYPSAIDIEDFILDNLKDVAGGRNTANIFNGAVYFWDHFAGKSHILKEYIGGYATRNLLDAVPAISNDYRIDANDAKGEKIPGRYIPVAQGFFINTVLDPDMSENITVDGGDVIFRNYQRAFIKETNPNDSQFLSPVKNEKTANTSDKKQKIRLDFKSPLGYNRQILVGVDPNTTNGFDLGYDAPINDYNKEDMFWLINGNQYVIQGVPDFNPDQVLPLGIRIEEEGEFSIRINDLENIPDNTNIYIRDNEDEIFHNLRESDFSMEIDPGNYNERFELVFQKDDDPEDEKTEEETEEEEEEPIGDGGNEEENIEVIFINISSQLAVLNPALEEITSIVIYDTSGKETLVYNNVSVQKEIRLDITRPLSSAVYVVKIYTAKEVYSKKLIINW